MGSSAIKEDKGVNYAKCAFMGWMLLVFYISVVISIKDIQISSMPKCH